MNLALLRAAITHIGGYLTVLTSLINQLGLFLPPLASARFNEAQLCYREFHQLHELAAQDKFKGSAAAFSLQVQACIDLQHTLAAYVEQLLEQIEDVIEEPLLTEKLAELRNVLRASTPLPPEENKEEKSELVMTGINKQAFSEKLQAFLATQQGLEKAFLASFDLGHVSDNGILAKRLGSHFPAVMQQQRLLYQLRKQLNTFTAEEEKAQASSFFPADKSAYADVAVLAWLVKPRWVTLLLKRKEVQLKAQLAAYRQTQEKLQLRLTEYFPTILRVFRILDVYQKWDLYLQGQSRLRVNQQGEKWTLVLANEQLLTYQKKAFFKMHFNQQSAAVLIKALQAYVQDVARAQIDSAILYQGLLQLYQQWRNDLQRKEQTLFKQAPLRSRAAATCLLAVTQQPSYQLGVMSARMLSKETESLRLPILNERLPPALEKKLEAAVGTSFLAITLAVSGSVGYSWHIIAALNHIFFAQYDTLVSTGRYLDSLTQRYCLPGLHFLQRHAPAALQNGLRWLEEFMRSDEIGLHEKEKLISYLTGLGIQLAMGGGEQVLATTGAYALAIGSSECASWATETLGNRYLLNSEQLSALKVMTHMATYSTAYRYGFQLIYEKTKTASPPFSQDKALKLFGFLSARDVSDSELRIRHRQLAMENHPDKCGAVCKVPMAEINAAYDVLTKKMK